MFVGGCYSQMILSVCVGDGAVGLWCLRVCAVASEAPMIDDIATDSFDEILVIIILQIDSVVAFVSFAVSFPVSLQRTCVGRSNFLGRRKDCLRFLRK